MKLINRRFAVFLTISTSLVLLAGIATSEPPSRSITEFRKELRLIASIEDESEFTSRLRKFMLSHYGVRSKMKMGNSFVVAGATVLESKNLVYVATDGDNSVPFPSGAIYAANSEADASFLRPPPGTRELVFVGSDFIATIDTKTGFVSATPRMKDTASD